MQVALPCGGVTQEAQESQSPVGFSAFCSVPMGPGTGSPQVQMGPRAASAPTLRLLQAAKLDEEEEEDEECETSEGTPQTAPSFSDFSDDARWCGSERGREGSDESVGTTLLQRLLSRELSLEDVERACSSSELSESFEGRVRGGLHIALPSACHPPH